MRDIYSSYSDNNPVENFTGTVELVSLSRPVIPKPAKPIVINASCNNARTIVTIQWRDNSGTAGYYTCYLNRTTPRLPGEHNMGPCYTTTTTMPGYRILNQYKKMITRNVPLQCEFRNLKPNVTYRYHIFGVKKGNGSIRVYSDEARGNL